MRFAALGLIEGFQAELIVSGINHGANLGDDITYSGTVAAALEGVVLGLPAIAVSQQSAAREMDFRLGDDVRLHGAAAFAARVVEEIEDVPLPAGTLLNINVPGGRARGRRGRAARQAHLPRRARASQERGRRRARSTGSTATRPTTTDEDGTDLAAVAAGRIAVTPLHFDLTDDARHRDAARATTSRACSSRRREEIE